MFPSALLKLLDLDTAISEANQKTDDLKSQIEKRKLEEQKVKEEKLAKAAKEKEEKME